MFSKEVYSTTDFFLINRLLNIHMTEKTSKVKLFAFIDCLSSEKRKKSLILKTEKKIRKLFKTRNKLPVHYKYTLLRKATQEGLSTE